LTYPYLKDEREPHHRAETPSGRSTRLSSFTIPLSRILLTALLYQEIHMTSHPRASTYLFPVVTRYIPANHCAVSATFGPAVARATEIMRALSEHGSALLDQHRQAITDFRASAAQLLRVDPHTVAFIPNCAHGLNLLANGLPLDRGDEIMTYGSEYPSNYYPWKKQEERGARLVVIRGRRFRGLPLKFTLSDLEAHLSDRTRVVALSHVQFTSGYAADLQSIGELCRSRGIIFIVDAAQSLGCMPVFPTECHADAVVSSGWKWLMGPVGSGVLYVSDRLRRTLQPVFLGPDMMQQTSYLDYRIDPFDDARQFEYSTLPSALAGGLAAAISHIASSDIEAVWARVRHLQDLFLDEIADLSELTVTPLEPSERSGILSFHTERSAEECATLLKERGVICSPREGYLRVAFHFYLSDDAILEAAHAFREVFGAVPCRAYA
jgi:cysteine desulfurase / selenocysteine lyase